MKTNFIIYPIETDSNPLYSFRHKSSENGQWMQVKSNPGYPCRVSLQDAQIGEKVLLVSYAHHDVDSAYRGLGPIFVRENALPAQLEINEVPKLLRHRLLSLRAYDCRGVMVEADVAAGDRLEVLVADLLQNQEVSYIHIHNARQGCYLCQLQRA